MLEQPWEVRAWRANFGPHETDAHEHRCQACGGYWICRRTDCLSNDLCEDCERLEWAEQTEPQPELPLVTAGKEEL